jgi:hypothetical protein
MVGGSSRLYDEELHNLHTSRSMRWPEHAVCMGEMNAPKDLVRKLEGMRIFEYLGIKGRIISDWIFGQ